MSRDCSEKLGIQRVFFFHFRDCTTTSRPVFGKSLSMKLWCPKYILYPCHRTVCSESYKLICSVYVLARAETSPLFIFFLIPPFYYSVAMISLREPAKVRHMRRRSSGLSSHSYNPQLYHSCFTLHLFMWEPRSHLVSYAILTRPNKAETAVHGC